MAPNETYSGILFLEEDLIILPNAKSAAFDFFRIPKKPIADTLKPIFSLQLPSLATGTRINHITCRAEPNPIADISRLNKKRRAQERADAGMDEIDGFSPKRGFLASADDAVCIFQTRYRTGPNDNLGGIDLFDAIGRSCTLFVHRSSFLELTLQYEETPLPKDQVEAGAALSSRRITWADWGPPVSRWFDATGTPSRWITTSAGQRSAMIRDDIGVTYGRPITILDFNPFNVRKMKAKMKREIETAKGEMHQELRSIADREDRLRTTEMGSVADEEDMPSLASEMEEPSPSTSAQSEIAMDHDMLMDYDSDPDVMSFFSDGMGEIYVVDDDRDSIDDDYDDDDDDDDFIGHIPGDVEGFMPGLESVPSSAEETHTSSIEYTTSILDHRHPGRALCQVFEAPSSVNPPGVFAGEVEGRLPYVAYVSERDYEYDGVLLDEERILGITVRSVFVIAL